MSHSVESIYFLDMSEYDETTSVYNRQWVPLCFLNCVSLLREANISSKIIQQHDLLNLNEQSLLFVSTGTIDKWFTPSLRLKRLQAFLDSYQEKMQIFLTGLHPTLFPDYFKKHWPQVNIIEGMPELAIQDYISCGRMNRNDKGRDLSIDHFPIPAFDLVKSSDYDFPAMGWDHFGVFEFARGCKESCPHCAKNCYYQNLKTHKIPEKFVKEISYAVNELGFRTGYMMDICFLTFREEALEFCRLLSEKKLPFVWACESKWQDFDSHSLELLYQAGCRFIGLGVASYEDVKEKDWESIHQTIIKIEEKGIRTLAYFIVDPFFSPLSKKSFSIFKLALGTPSTYCNIRRYLDFNSPRWLELEIQKKTSYKGDALDLGIKLTMMIYYLQPRRVFKIIRLLKFKRLIKAFYFFIKFLARK